MNNNNKKQNLSKGHERNAVTIIKQGLPRWRSGEDSVCNADVFDPWTGKNLWRRK